MSDATGSTYHQERLKEYCVDFGVKKPTATDVLCAKLMDAGLDIHWRPGFDFKVIRKTTGCEGRLALCVSKGWRGYADCPWAWQGQTGHGVDLMRTTGELAESSRFEFTKNSYDAFIWVDAEAAEALKTDTDDD